MLRADVFVIGGGPAGLATAIAACQAGFRTIVADCATPPIDKACGEGLMPNSLAALRRLGIRLDLDNAAVITGIRFLEGRRRVEATFPDEPGATVRRTLLHQQLIDHASAFGVEALWGARRILLDRDNVSIDGERIEAKFIVGADGHNSQVRKSIGLGAVRYESRRYGFRQHFRVRPWTSFVEVYWGSNRQLYVTPVRENEIGVALISDNPRLRIAEALEGFPQLKARIGVGNACATEMGGLTVSRRLRKVWRGNVALVGDASGSVDSITGEGLCLAFRQASALANAMKRNDLPSYQQEHDRINRRTRMMARLLLVLAKQDGLRNAAVALLARQPSVFSAVLGVHIGLPWDALFGASQLSRVIP